MSGVFEMPGISFKINILQKNICLACHLQNVSRVGFQKILIFNHRN